MAAVCGCVQSLNGNGYGRRHSVLHRTGLLRRYSGENAGTSLKLADGHENLTQTHKSPPTPRASRMAALSVSILLYRFPDDCQHNLAALGSISELILDGNSSLTLN